MIVLFIVVTTTSKNIQIVFLTMRSNQVSPSRRLSSEDGERGRARRRCAGRRRNRRTKIINNNKFVLYTSMFIIQLI